MSMRKINGRMDALRRFLRNVGRQSGCASHVKRTNDPAWMKHRRNEWFAAQSAAKRASKATA